MTRFAARLALVAAAFAGFAALAPGDARACGAAKDDPCETPLGTYYVAAPAGG